MKIKEKPKTPNTKGKDRNFNHKTKGGKIFKPMAKKTSSNSEMGAQHDKPRTFKKGKQFSKQNNKSSQPSSGPVKSKRPSVILKPVIGQKWWTILENLDKSTQSTEESDEPAVAEVETEEEKPMTKEEIQMLEDKASKLLDNDSQAYRQGCLTGEKRSDFLWMDGIMKNGTLPDKMAAYIVRVQDSPIHNLSCLQQLISMVKVQSRQQCLMTADTARDLFLEDLLPPGRKLILFEARGTKLRKASDKELMFWIFEHRLKLQYQSFLEALKRMSTDQVDKMRGKAIVVLAKLLISHPEQEQTLLELLVNKLGDPVKKIASKALFHLNEVVKAHPLMKLIVVEEVERLLFRNNIGKKAQYYGICYLNLISLAHTEAQLAVKLVKVYLAFFKACVKTGEIDSKMMGALLNGVNRAFPIAKMAGMEFGESLVTLYKIVQLSQFSIGIQALALLFHVTDIDSDPSQADRFYNSLYRKLLSEDLYTTAHSLQFINLVYKAMKRDKSVSRVRGFAKRLLQVCCGAPSNIACALLFLISEVSKNHKNILSMGHKIKQEEEADAEATRVREEQEEIEAKAAAVDLEKLSRTTNIVKVVVVKSKQRQSEQAEPEPVIDIDCGDEEGNPDDVVIKEECRAQRYDPMARNPKYCGAEFTFGYELLALARHAHPSVALFAQTLLRQENIKYTGNPIKDFTVSRFLERFVFRNPKANPTRPKYQPAGLRNVPVNSNSYLDAKEEDIPVEEKFFYKFYKSQKKSSTKIKKETDEEGSDAESIGDEEFESIMDNYFKTHGPKEDSSEDEDEDIDFASEIKKSTKKRKGKQAEEESDDEIEDDEEEATMEEDEGADADEFVQMDSDDEPEFDGDDDEMDNEDDSLPPNMFDDDEDEFINFSMPSTSHRKGKAKLQGQSTFAPAEKFSEILEANADMAFTGSNDLINKDNADIKQLKWEMERDRWVKGHKNKQKQKSFKRKPNSGAKPAKRRKLK